ncbi:MAG: hypothetical protein GF317_07885 [Candidatus Lokiarchaeota archaeon]|nr:hypothetical protein [Candidatus Lokiarchaeota archaeon]MBD3199632.1 hypothetical protein [Candidatus Lokiarchaeota archaeon]
MNLIRQRDFIDAIILHLIFAAIAMIIFLIPINIENGIRIFILVLIYNVLIPSYAYYKKYFSWINIWIFCFLISIFQIFPDWFLSAVLNILVFPEDGLFKIGTVSGYMFGLWSIPLFIIVFLTLKIKESHSQKSGYMLNVFASFLIFTISELTIWMLGSWYPQNVTIIFGHLAVYIIIPEIILGISSYYFYDFIKEKPQLIKIPISFLIMLIYQGAATFFYFIFEYIIFY